MSQDAKTTPGSGQPTGRERLQKVLARAGVASRRRIEELIREGRVTLNGRPAELGDRADLEVDAVKVDGRRIAANRRPHQYLLVNKPRAVVSTADDPEQRKTVLELIPVRLRKGLVPVGRLDYDSEGLLLLTTDGDFAHRVAHPRFGCVKTYEVKVKGHPKPGDIERLRRGVLVHGRPTAPARIDSFNGPEGLRESSHNSWWRVAIGEGRTRQIREMFMGIGHQVQRLRRVAIGPVSDALLARGSWRNLTNEEVEGLLSGSTKAPVLVKGRRSRPERRPKGPGTGKGRKAGGGAKKGAKKVASRSAEENGSRSTRGAGAKGRGGGPKGRGGSPGSATKGRRPSRGPKRSGRGAR